MKQDTLKNNLRKKLTNNEICNVQGFNLLRIKHPKHYFFPMGPYGDTSVVPLLRSPGKTQDCKVL